MSRDVFGCHNMEGGGAAEARDAVEHPIMHRAVPHYYSAPTVSRTRVEKP